MRVEGAFGCVVKDGKFLLTKNKYNPNWFFPGGEIEEEENPQEAVKREMMEELDMEVKPLELVNRSKVSHFSPKYDERTDYTIYHFLCETDDEPVKNEEVIEEINYFELGELEEINTTDDVIESARKISKTYQ